MTTDQKPARTSKRPARTARIGHVGQAYLEAVEKRNAATAAAIRQIARGTSVTATETATVDEAA